MMRHQRIRHAVSVWACWVTALLLTGTFTTARAANELSYVECLRALDRTVLHVDEVDIDTAQHGLATLAQSCEEVPQIHHNMGVIAARQAQWETAIAAFERAIRLAPRTADSVAQLKAIHEYQAKKAWQVALQADEEVLAPEFSWQTSSDLDQRVSANAHSVKGLKSVATLDFELYDWWHALEDESPEAWLKHYVNGYPAPTLDQIRPVPWESVSREIQFTARDAAVALKWTKNGQEHHRWLLLTLAGERWQIYHEAEL